MSKLLALGMDLSLNHAGIVLVDAHSFALERALFVTQKKGPCEVAAHAKGVVEGRRLDMPNFPDRQTNDLWRLAWWYKLLAEVREWGAKYVGIEDYAFAARASSVYQYGELGGLARFVFRRRCMRYHDPQSVKLFGASSGRAESSELEVAVRKQWRVDFRRYNASKVGPRVSEDLAVAYTLARMVATEWQLRKGILLFSNLEEDAIRVFNRVTKQQPTNILARSWVTLEGE